jgi:hypothetical protein
VHLVECQFTCKIIKYEVWELAKITRHVAVFRGQHCLVRAYDAEEWVYSLVEELYFARNCQQISKTSMLVMCDWT